MNNSTQVEEITLSNGFRIPAIGFGTFPNKENLLEIIPNAIQTGYRLFDTSDNYQNEEFVGEAIRKSHSELSGDGDKVITVTKFSQGTAASKFEIVFQKSFRNLFIDNEEEAIDIYLMHWPYPFLYPYIWKQMEKKYKEGKCKAIGVCNFELKHLNKLMKACEIKPMINQLECHPMFRQATICDYCQSNDIQIMSYSPLARMHPKLMENEILMAIAAKYNKSVSQIILRWNYQHKFISIAGTKSLAHMQNNFNIFNFELRQSDMEQIDSLDCGMRIRFDPNKRFSLLDKLLFVREKLLTLRTYFGT